MKMRRLLCLCASGIALVASSPVSGQTVTPSPTALPTASTAPIPSGADLLRSMKDAMRAAGTGRYTIQVPSTGRWATRSMHEVDVSGTVPRVHILDRERPPSTQSAHGARYEIIIIGKREAFRSTYGGWICSVNDRMFADDSSLLQLPGPLTHVSTVGLDHVGGAAVWHVSARSAHVSHGNGEKHRLDFYIDQGSMLLQRQNRATTFYQKGRAPIIGAFSMIYSRYGAPLHIALPKACR